MIVRVLGLTSYLGFLAAFLYFLAFVTGFLPGQAPAGSLASALAIDVALVAFFGVVHSVMARPGFKRWSARWVPAAAERSLYVLVASAQLALLVWQWRPLSGPSIWSASAPLSTILTGAQLLGFGIAFLSTCLIDHFELFGLRQSFGRDAGPSRFRTPFLYRAVRHPLYLGLLIALWCAPHMSLGRLALAVGLTIYVVIGAHFEERDLVRAFGDEYRQYQRKVPMILPLT